MKLTYEQAVDVARAYLEANPLHHHGYRHVLTTGKAVSEGWFFGFDFERVDGRKLSESDEFAGAPGYLVSAADGKVRVIGWAEYHKRRLGAT